LGLLQKLGTLTGLVFIALATLY